MYTRRSILNAADAHHLQFFTLSATLARDTHAARLARGVRLDSTAYVNFLVDDVDSSSGAATWQRLSVRQCVHNVAYAATMKWQAARAIFPIHAKASARARAARHTYAQNERRE